MKTRRAMVAALGVLAALALPACSATSTGSGNAGFAPIAAPPSTSPAIPERDPGTALRTAIAGLRGTGYNVALTDGGLTGTGSVDPDHHAGTLIAQGAQQGVATHLGYTQIGMTAWVRLDLGGLDERLGFNPRTWMRMDIHKLGPGARTPFTMTGAGDPYDITGLMASVNALQWVDTSHLSGTVDLTAALGPAAPAAEALAQAGTAARSTPFVAVLDGRGRLANLRIDADAFDTALTMDYGFTNYGSPAAVKPPPAAHVKPAPAAAYDFFDSAN